MMKFLVTKNVILFIITFYSCSLSYGQIAKDKQLHLGAGIVIGAVGGYTAKKIFRNDPNWAWAGAVGSSLAAGLLKEKMDYNEYGIWDDGDIIYTTIGGIISGLALELFFNEGRRRRGKPCSCYAVQVDLLKLGTRDFELHLDVNGSRDLSANLQAQSLLSHSFSPFGVQ